MFHGFAVCAAASSVSSPPKNGMNSSRGARTSFISAGNFPNILQELGPLAINRGQAQRPGPDSATQHRRRRLSRAGIGSIAT